MTIQSPLPGIRFAATRQTEKPASAVNKTAQANGTAPGHRLLRKAFIPAFLAVPAAIGLGLPALSSNAQAQQPAPAVATQTPGQLNTGSSPVNQASDIRHITAEALGRSQKVVDMVPPLLSPKAYQEINDLLNQLQVGQGSVVVIPSTDRPDMNSLATDIYNQIGIGQQGENKGFLLLVNADGVKHMTRGKQMTLKPGSASKAMLSNETATRILIDNAVPSLRNKDYDTAVKKTVAAVKALMEQDAKANQPVAPGVPNAPVTPTAPGVPNPNPVQPGNPANPSGGSSMTAEQRETLGMVLLGLLALVGVTAGSIYGGVKVYKWQADRKQKAFVVDASLKQMESSYKVGVMNVFSFKTAEALLSRDTANVDMGLFRNALETNMQQVTDEPTRAQYRKLFIEKGLNHTAPAVRSDMIARLTRDKVGEDLFQPFLNRLAIEEEPSVITQLETPLVQMAKADNVQEFATLANSKIAATRHLSFKVIDKFFKDENFPKYFELLGKEPADSKDNIQLVSETIIKRTKGNPALFDDTLLEQLKSENPACKDTAIRGLGAAGIKDNFKALFEAYKNEPGRTFDAAYDAALPTLADAAHLDTIHQGLAATPRVQDKALDLIGQLKNTASVAPLLEYLEKDGGSHPNQAVDLTAACTTQANNDILLDKLQTATKPLARLAAVKGLNVIGASANVGKLLQALEKEDNADIEGQLNAGILKSAAAENNSLFVSDKNSKGGIYHTQPRIRQLSAQVLGKLANPANTPDLYAAYSAEAPGAVEADLKKAIESSAQKQNVPFLLTQLGKSGSDQPRVRQLTAELLGKFPDAKSTGTLFEALSLEKEQPVEAAITTAAKACADSSNLPFLLTQLGKSGSPQGRVRQLAAELVGKFPDAKSTETLFEALELEKEKPVEATIKTAAVASAAKSNLPFLLTKLGKSGSDQPRVRQLAAQLVAKFPQATSTDRLFEALEMEKDAGVESQLQHSITACVDGSNRSVLEGKLKSDQPRVRLASANGLGAIKQPAATPALFDALAAEKEAPVEAAVTQAIYQSAKAENVPYLLTKLGKSGSDQARVRQAAATLLERNPVSSSVPRLFEALELEKDNGVEQTLQGGIKASAQKENIGLLEEKLTSQQSRVRLVSADGLNKLKNSGSVDKLLTALEQEKDSAVEPAISRAIESSVQGANVPVLEGKLGSKLDKVRLICAKSLGNMKNPGSVPKLLTALETESNPTIESTLVSGISASLDKRHQGELETRVAQTNKSLLRGVAADGLKTFNQVESLPSLFTALPKEREATAKGKVTQAIEALSKNPQALPVLSQVLVSNQAEEAQLMAIGQVSGFGFQGVPALFNGLEKTGSSTAIGVVNAYKGAITQNGSGENALELMDQKAANHHAQVSDVSQAILGKHIAGWGAQGSYDDPETMTRINHYRQHSNGQVQGYAAQAKSAVMGKKIDQVRQWGQSGQVDDSHYAGAKRTLEDTRRTAPDVEVRQAAESSLGTLSKRRTDYQLSQLSSYAAASVTTASSFNSAIAGLEALASSAESGDVSSGVNSAISSLRSKRQAHIEWEEEQERIRLAEEARRRAEEEARRQEEARLAAVAAAAAEAQRQADAAAAESQRQADAAAAAAEAQRQADAAAAASQSQSYGGGFSDGGGGSI